MKDLGAFVLIGGRSTRFGRDKAEAEFDGETLAVRAARLVETSLSPERIIYVTGVASQLDHGTLYADGREVIADKKPGFGAWSGVHAALSHSRSTWILVLACDLPLVSVDMLRLLASFAIDGIDVVVPRQPDGQLQPLCAIYRVTPVRAHVEKILEGNGLVPPLSSIFEILASHIVGPDEYAHLDQAGGLFLNVNREADLRAASAYRRA